MTGESTAARPGDSTDGTPATADRPATGRAGGGAGPWAETGPDTAWWRGDPTATAARFATVRAPEPPVPPAPTVSLTPQAQPAPARPGTGHDPATTTDDDPAGSEVRARLDEPAEVDEAADVDRAAEVDEAAEVEGPAGAGAARTADARVGPTSTSDPVTPPSAVSVPDRTVADPVETHAAEAHAAEADPAGTDPAGPEPTKRETARTETVETETARTERAGTGPTETETAAAHTEPADPPVEPPAPPGSAPRTAEFVEPASTSPPPDEPAPTVTVPEAAGTTTRSATTNPRATPHPDEGRSGTAEADVTPEPDVTAEPDVTTDPVGTSEPPNQPEPSRRPEAAGRPEPAAGPEAAPAGRPGANHGPAAAPAPVPNMDREPIKDRAPAKTPAPAKTSEPAMTSRSVKTSESAKTSESIKVLEPAGSAEPAGEPEAIGADPDRESAGTDGGGGAPAPRDGVEPTIGVDSAQLELPAQPAVAARPVPVVPDGVGRAAVPAARGAEPARVAGPADDDPFWLPVEEMPGDGTQGWPTQRMRGGRRRLEPAAPRRGKIPRPPRRPIAGLASLVVLALVATFFAWVSAEPLWLALGRGNDGTATVTSCAGNGVGQRCEGAFTSAGGTFTTESVRLLGVAEDQRNAGTRVSARMVDADSGTAYVAGDPTTLHLRWALGLTLVLLCGVGIVWATGALRLTDRRSRRLATLTSLAAPLLLTIGFLAATF
ncbi:hypothetical protein [Polymorphospora rubra]|uniref:hypothetical protein n=1 Tax=Polymorphospora rubra TaxID=338584 RepID=UPI0033F0D77F